MALSRGFNLFVRARISVARPATIRQYSDFVRAATNPENKSQIYISRSLDPYLNLSIEHYLLQKTPADSTILFLYTNRPSVVIGRNQNPWVEVNLGLLRTSGLRAHMVRRRSGGGTVFHDEGNVNYSVICHTSEFNRDKHAEMVVRALQKLGVHEARVNCRHDIVLGGEYKCVDNATKPLKISGSAYKLTRLRSLHHGTCLLSSPNLGTIGKYLRSPAKPFIKARGVESVSSPITNVNVSNESFERAVAGEFGAMYEDAETVMVGQGQKEVPEIAKGFEELASEDWTYSQTPQFSFSFQGSADTGTPIDVEAPQGFTVNFTARNARITEIDIGYNGQVSEQEEQIKSLLLNKKLHEISDWTEELPELGSSERPRHNRGKSRELSPGVLMNELFGVGKQNASYFDRQGLGI